MSEFKTLRVKKIERESDEAITVHFKQPLFNKLKYDAGQFLTFRMQIDGKQVYRSYSLCSAPRIDKHLSVTVKRVKDGFISNYLNDYLKEGDSLPATLSRSQFLYSTEQSVPEVKHLILISAGSGITPILSILKTALHAYSDISVHLLYGSRQENKILHKTALDELSEQFKDRLKVTHVISQPSHNWDGESGRLDEHTITRLVKSDSSHMNAAYYICGPEGMMQSAVSVLTETGIRLENIHTESFTGSGMNKDDSEIPEFGDRTIRLNIQGQQKSIDVANGQTILEAALDASIDVPFSCRSGFCSACQCQLTSGQVHIKDNNCLTDKEKKQNKVLLCVGYAQSDDIVIDL